MVSLGDLNCWPDPVPFVTPAPPCALSPALASTLPGRIALAIEAKWSVPAIVSFTTALGVTSAATCGRFTVAKDINSTFPTALFLAPLLNPGGLKSAVLGALSSPLRAAQLKTAARLDPQISERMRRCSATTQALATMERKMAAALANGDPVTELEASAQALELTLADRDPGEFNAPFRPVSFGSDATPEALVKRAASQGGRVAVLAAEGGLLENLAGRYSDNGSAKVEFLQAAYDGEPYEGSRVSDGARDIPTPWASLLLVVQPDVAATMLGSTGMRTRGFLQRFWLFLPPTADYLARTSMPPLPSDLLAEWERVTVGIWGDDGFSDWATPVVIQMPTGCRKKIEAFEQEFIAPTFARAADDGNALLQGWLGKTAMTTWRVAALLAQLEAPRTTRVSVTATAAAIDFAKMATSHAEHLFAHGPTAATRLPKFRVLAGLVRGIESIEDAAPGPDEARDDGSGGIEDAPGTEFTKNALYQHMRGQVWVTGADSIEAVLQDLGGLGWVRFVGPRTTELGGRPREVWKLHPDAKAHFTSMTGTA